MSVNHPLPPPLQHPPGLCGPRGGGAEEGHVHLNEQPIGLPAVIAPEDEKQLRQAYTLGNLGGRFSECEAAVCEAVPNACFTRRPVSATGSSASV